MKSLREKMFGKILVFTISFLMVLQSVVSANPDIVPRTTLGPELITAKALTPEEYPEYVYRHVVTNLRRIEANLANHSVPRMREEIDTLVARFRSQNPAIPERMLQVAIPSDEEVLIDLGPAYRIRYYDHTIEGAGDPGEYWQIIESEPLSTILAKQIIVRIGHPTLPETSKEQLAASQRREFSDVKEDLLTTSLALHQFAEAYLSENLHLRCPPDELVATHPRGQDEWRIKGGVKTFRRILSKQYGYAKREIELLITQLEILAQYPDTAEGKEQALQAQVEYLRNLKAFRNAIEVLKAGLTEQGKNAPVVAPTFSTLAEDTSIKGDDASRKARLDLFKREGTYMAIPQGRAAERDKLGYEYTVVSVIVPKDSIPVQLKNQLKDLKKEKEISAAVGHYLTRIFKNAKIHVSEKQMRTQKLNPEEIGPISFDAKSAIATITDKGDLLIQVHFWTKRDYKALEQVNRFIKSRLAFKPEELQISEDLSAISTQARDSETALGILARYGWLFYREFSSGNYTNASNLAKIIDTITPDTLLNIEDITYDATLGAFISNKDKKEAGFGENQRKFSESLNSIQQLVTLLYFLAVPDFDEASKKGKPVDNAELQNNIIDLYYRIYEYLYDIAKDEKKFGNIAVFEPLRIQIGLFANKLNHGIRASNAVEINSASYESIVEHINTQLAQNGTELSETEKAGLKKIYEASKGRPWAYDILQLTEVLTEEHFLAVFRHLKVDSTPGVLPSDRPFEAFDGSGRIGTLGLALRVSFDMNNREEGYYPRYLVRSTTLVEDGKTRQEVAVDKAYEMFEDDVIATSGLDIKTKDGKLVAISDLVGKERQGRLTFSVRPEVLSAKQDFVVTSEIPCIYPVDINLDGEKIGTIYFLDSAQFTEEVKKLGVKQDNVPRPYIVSEKGEDTYFGMLTDATPGGVWIGDGVMESLLEDKDSKNKDFEKITVWQLAAVRVLPRSAVKTLDRVIKMLKDMPNTQETIDKIEAAKVELGQEELKPLAQILPSDLVADIKSFYGNHKDLSQEDVKKKILGGAQDELERLKELLAQIRKNRLADRQKIFYLKAQIPKKLLLPLGGSINFMGGYLQKLALALGGSSTYATTTSCSTNGASYITLMLSVMFGGFGRNMISIVATTFHMYTGGDKEKGPYGHSGSQSTGAAEGVLQHLRAKAMFAALRVPTTLVPTATGASKAVAKLIPELAAKLGAMTTRGPEDSKIKIVGGSAFDYFVQFPYPVQLEVVNRFIRRVGAEFSDILKVFGVKNQKDGRYRWEDTISGQRTGSILFEDHITQVAPDVLKLVVGYDNEMSFSYKMVELAQAMSLAAKRQEAIIARHRSLTSTTSPGAQHVRQDFNSEVPLTQDEYDRVNKAIKETIDAGKAVEIVNTDARTGGKFVVLEDDSYNAALKKHGAPLDVEVHPGTRRTRERYDAARHDETYSLVEKRYYVRKSIFDALSREEREILARHEAAHIDSALGIIVPQPSEWATEEAWVNRMPGCDIRPIMKRLSNVIDRIKVIVNSELTPAKIEDNARRVMPRLRNALISASEKAKKADQKEAEKIVLALDTGLGKGLNNRLIGELIEVFANLRATNKNMADIFGRLEIIKGEGANLSERIRNITAANGAVKAQNVIIVTNTLNSRFYQANGLADAATIAAIDDADFPEKAYYPLAEIALFAIGKHLGWDIATLRSYYGMIPNVKSSDSLSVEEALSLFGADKRRFVIRIIPDAVQFSDIELQNLMNNIKEMLASA